MRGTTVDRPAFPYLETGDCGQREGMSLRDYFAAHATSTDVDAFIMHYPTKDVVVTHFDGTKSITRAPQRRTLTEAKYAYSDAMLEARK